MRRLLPAQLSQGRRDRRQLAITGLPPSGRQRRVLSLLDQVRPAFGERPLDRPPLLIVDLQFQMSPALGVVIGLPGNQVGDIARCGLSQRANLLHSWATCIRHPSGWSDPHSGAYAGAGSAFPLRTTDGELPVQRLKAWLKEVDPS